MLQNMGTDAINERLGRLPPTLAELYEEIHCKFYRYAARAERHIARHVLSWLLCSKRTLKSNEFLAMVSITPNTWLKGVSRDLVLQLCCNFVIYDDELDIFRFAHLSVREFLEGHRDYGEPIVNRLAAKSCLLAVISSSIHPTADDFLRRNKYIVGYKDMLASRTIDPRHHWTRHSNDLIGFSIDMYAIIYWPVHCQQAGRIGSSMLQHLLWFFLTPDIDTTWPYNSWFDCMDHQRLDSLDFRLRERLLSSGPDPIFAACAFDLMEYVSMRIKSKGPPPTNIKNTDDWHPLHVAMRFGSLSTVKLLLKRPDVSVAGQVFYNAAGMSPAVMKLLLNIRGADLVMTPDVWSAAERNTEMARIVQEFAGNELYAACQTEYSCKGRGYSKHAHKTAFQVTLRNIQCYSRNPDVKSHGETMLLKCAKKAQVAATLYLLRSGANPHIANINGITPLQIARQKHHNRIASLLEQHIRDNHWIASERGPQIWCPHCLKRYLNDNGHKFCRECHDDIPHDNEYILVPADFNLVVKPIDAVIVDCSKGAFLPTEIVLCDDCWATAKLRVENKGLIQGSVIKVVQHNGHKDRLELRNFVLKNDLAIDRSLCSDDECSCSR